MQGLVFESSEYAVRVGVNVLVSFVIRSSKSVLGLGCAHGIYDVCVKLRWLP